MKEFVQASPVKRAFISVTDKEGLLPLAFALVEKGVDIVASDGTAFFLREHGIAVSSVGELTHFPEILGGRVKTLHPAIFGGILFKRDDLSHREELSFFQLKEIDLVVCNLYPFTERQEKTVDLIDIGGVSLIRAAAKNSQWVSILCHPCQYELFLSEFRHRGEVSGHLRREFAKKAFQLTAYYDFEIANAFMGEESFLRYGENPHQEASLSPLPLKNPFAPRVSLTPLQGVALSYNNLLDLEAAWQCCSELYHLDSDEKVCVIVKHAAPCGVAQGDGDSLALLEASFECDPVSAFGGVLCCSFPITGKEAKKLQGHFLEMVVAPSFDEEALAIFSSKKKLRLLELPMNVCSGMSVRSLWGEYLLRQSSDCGVKDELISMTQKALPREKEALALFGLLVVKYLKSNAVVLVQEVEGVKRVMGAGMGQPNRVECFTHLAWPRSCVQSKADASEMILVGDGFYPFPDVMAHASSLGISTFVQPGGSKRDEEVILKADELGVVMAHGRYRHFRH